MIDKVEALLGKARNRVKLVGIELEGGWATAPPGHGSQIIRDGSVNFDELIPRTHEPYAPSPYDFVNKRDYKAAVAAWEEAYKAWQEERAKYPQYIGELPSTPLPVKDIDRWMKACYPSHVNRTCGLHVHMSFNTNMTYQRLMRPEYTDVMVEFLRRWAVKECFPEGHHIFERLAGNSQYCQKKYFGDAQARLNRKTYERAAKVHRYTIINYSANTHGTIECRVLPMMDTVEQAIRAINEVIRITNAFVLTEIKREQAERVEIMDNEGIVPPVEEINLCV